MIAKGGGEREREEDLISPTLLQPLNTNFVRRDKLWKQDEEVGWCQQMFHKTEINMLIHAARNSLLMGPVC